MLKLTKITGESLFINPDSITTMEDCGDTLVWMGTKSIRIQESVEQVQKLFLEYKIMINRPSSSLKEGIFEHVETR